MLSKQFVQTDPSNSSQTEPNIQPSPPSLLGMRRKQKTSVEEEKQVKAENNFFSDVCAYCHKDGLVQKQSEGTIVCTLCGVVNSSRVIDNASEWRNFSSDNGSNQQNQNRVGGPSNMLFEGGGMATDIKGSAKHDKLMKYNVRTNYSNFDKAMQKGLQRIKEFSSKLNIKDSVRKTADGLFAIVEKSEKLKGKNLDAKVAMLLFVASRKKDQPKQIKDILAITGVQIKDLNKCYKKFKEIQPDEHSNISLSEHAGVICNKLDYSMAINQLSKHIGAKIQEKEIMTGKQPGTLAGAAVFMALEKMGKTTEKSLTEISEKVQLSEQTIKGAFKDLLQFQQIIFPDQPTLRTSGF